MEFSEHYVAYFDVLGYKEAFKKSEDVSLKLAESIESSVKLIRDFVSTVNDSPGDEPEKYAKIKYKVFSDNILICYENTNGLGTLFALMFFLRLTAFIQRVLFDAFKLIVRGGVTKGSLYLSDDFVAGKALIDAVELEANAVYPRLVVDERVLNDLHHKNQNFLIENYCRVSCSDLLVRDVDQKTILNYIVDFDPWIVFPKDSLSSERMESFDEVMAAVKENRLGQPRFDAKCLGNIYKTLERHKEFVEKNIEAFSVSLKDSVEDAKRLKILKKYLWMASFHNKLCDEMYGMPELKIVVQSVFNEQTLAFDVSVG